MNIKQVLKLLKYKKAWQLNPIDFVSHELKTPLSTLKLNVELLKKQAGSQQKKVLNIMEEEIDWIIQFTSDTLDLSQFRHKIMVQPKKQDWSQWIQILKPSAQSIADLSDITLNWPDSINRAHTKPPSHKIEVLIDPLYMKQALLNLIKNAVQHSPEKGTVHISWDKTPKNQLKVQVTDQGVGIAKKDLKKIFKPFYQSRLPSNSKAIKGNGLGLAIAQQIITAHGGKLKVQNHLKGALFTFTLPLTKTL